MSRDATPRFCECGNQLPAAKPRGAKRVFCDACLKKRRARSNRKWKDDNPEVVKKTNHRWYQKNRQSNSTWREKNKRRAKAWRAKNRAHVLKYDRARGNAR